MQATMKQPERAQMGDDRTVDKEVAISRDPVTLYPVVEIAGRLVVLKRDAADDFMEKPAKDVIECAF